jgi:tetratricopeptide (TPR) repeat protein
LISLRNEFGKASLLIERNKILTPEHEREALQMATTTKDPNVRGYLGLGLCSYAENPMPYMPRFWNLRDNPFTLVQSEVMGNRSVAVFRKASAMLNPAAEFNIGNYFSEAGDAAKSLYYYSRSAWYGNTDALPQMARCKMRLFDFPGALELFRASTDLPDPPKDSGAYYGAILKIVKKDRQSLAEADRYIERSVRAGWSGAQWAVTLCKHEGVSQNQLEVNCANLIMDIGPRSCFGPDGKPVLLPGR